MGRTFTAQQSVHQHHLHPEQEPPIGCRLQTTADPFHKRWRRWLWIVCFPSFVLVFFQNVFFISDPIYGDLYPLYTRALEGTTWTAAVVTVLHLVLRIFCTDESNPNRALISRNAIWRDTMRTTPFSKHQDNDRWLLAVIGHPFSGFIRRKGLLFIAGLVSLLAWLFPAKTHRLFGQYCRPDDWCFLFSESIVVINGEYVWEAFTTNTFFLLTREYDDGSGD